MLQEPLPELRSFQSLSKFVGDPRTTLGRRTSVNHRRLSHVRRKTEQAEKTSLDSSFSNKEKTFEMPDDIRTDFDDNDEDSSDSPFGGIKQTTFFCLKQTSFPRKWCLSIVMSPWFDRITMSVILINCITLGMYRPCEDGVDCVTLRCQILTIIDHLIFLYFVVEMFIKIIALGVGGPSGYLSDTWNRLDCFIVTAGIMEIFLQEYLGGNINLTAIRTVRVLRPLKAVNRIPSMRILVNLLLDTLPMLGNVLLLCFFVFFIFGIVGVQLWAGLLRNRCAINLPTTMTDQQIALFNDVKLTRYYIPEDTTLEYICSQEDANGLHTCSNLPPFAINGRKCNLTIEQFALVNEENCINWNIYYNECQAMQRNPFQGSVSFDNIGFAWVAIFLVISLEGWTDIMYYVQDAHSFWNWIYFVLLIVVNYIYIYINYFPFFLIGAFFMINLCLVVIATQFAETKRRETERMLQERRALQKQMSNEALGGNNEELYSPSDSNESIYAAIIKMIQQYYQTSKKEIIKNTEKLSSWSELRQKIKSFVICDHFTRGILVAILVNTLSMGVEYHQQPELLTTILEYSNLFFTGLFAFEMVLKIVADGLFCYLGDGFNLFDGSIVVLSVLELFQEGKGGLSVLRTFRLLRILKLVRFMPALRYQLVVMLRTMDNVTVFFGLLVLFIFIFSILGMNLFGCKFCKHEERPLDGIARKCERKNFDTLLWALITVFQILTQEDWNMVLFNGMAQTNPWAALYFVTLMTFGNYVLFNLLVAILVEGFQESKVEEKRQLENDTAFNPENSAIDGTNENENSTETNPNNLGEETQRLCLSECERNDYFSAKDIHYADVSMEERNELSNVQNISERCYVTIERKRMSLIGKEVVPKNESRKRRIRSWNGYHDHSSSYSFHPDIQAVTEITREAALVQSLEYCKANSSDMVHKNFSQSWVGRRKEYSLFCFSKQNLLRTWCFNLTQNRWFDYFILMFIGMNCITLAMERPSIPPDSFERKFLIFSSYMFTAIFSTEMFLKIIANGCFIGKSAYFKDGWNVLDGILVIISLINAFIEVVVAGDSPKILGVIRVLRLLRALRPLRVINRAPGVKLVVMTLISSLKPIGNIVLICCTFFIIFGILGVQLFKGTMFHCVGPEILNITTKAGCLSDHRNKWINHRYNFDNLGQALMSLFVLSSKDGWVSIMYQGIDAVGVDMQPIENYNEWRMIYFISFLLLVGFFVLNMFVGVVVENFHKCKETLEKEMREKAREKRMQRYLRRRKFEEDMAERKKTSTPSERYWQNYGPTRLFLHSIVTSKYFDLAISAVIGINIISMAIEFYMMPVGLKYVLKALNYFFTAVFTFETALKIYSLGFRNFMRERWNQLDIFIVLLSIAGIIFEEFEALELPVNPTIIRVMRVLRIARVLKLLKMAKGIRYLLDTVGEALPQVGNLGSLFFLLFFIFAALGVELFGKIECSEQHPCDGLGEHAHFKNFGMAFLTLFRIATGDNWNGIMKDALRDDCDTSEHCKFNCCVDPILAPCFFVVFVLISQFVLVNVVVAVLMKHLEESNKQESENAKNAKLQAEDNIPGHEFEILELGEQNKHEISDYTT
ncbi:unnamed protein product [Auanema sp. JU1783]|nr:unnamed protein product [Auanema sp. JU1783]